jgi:hypothetical protein
MTFSAELTNIHPQIQIPFENKPILEPAYFTMWQKSTLPVTGLWNKGGGGPQKFLNDS